MRVDNRQRYRWWEGLLPLVSRAQGQKDGGNAGVESLESKVKLQGRRSKYLTGTIGNKAELHCGKLLQCCQGTKHVM